MPLSPISIKPGINTQLTQVANSGGWSFSNLIRWKLGQAEKIAGWLRLFGQKCAGLIRALHAFEDLSLNKTLLIGTDGGAQIYLNGTLNNVLFTGAGSLLNLLGTGITFSTTMGSNIVAVSDPNGAAIPGGYVQCPILMCLGGVFIQPGTVCPIVAFTSNDSYSFQMPNAAVNSNPFQLPLFFIQPNSTFQTLEIPLHGLVPGNTFTTSVSTSIVGGSTCTFTMPAGTVLTVLNVLDVNQFSFTGGPYGFSSSLFDVYEGQISNINTEVITQPVIILYSAAQPAAATDWFLDNLGQDGLFSFTNSPIFAYLPPPPSSNFTAINVGVTTAPQINAGMFVAMPQAQIIAFGSEAIIGGGVQDPLLLRWSDAGSYSVWTASSTNQAGSYHLSRGSRVVGGLQAPQTTLIWTDTDLWSMQYIAPPLVYSFIMVGSGCGLIAPHASAVVGRVTYWLGTHAIWQFGDSGVELMDCPVWDVIFTNIDRNNAYKCHVGANAELGVVKFFFPSLSGGTGEIDSYIEYNVMEQLWDYGSPSFTTPGAAATVVARTAWIDDNIFGPPLGGDLNSLVQQHETGYDNDAIPMAGCFIESGFFDLGGGDQMMFLDSMLPDLKWFGNIPNAAVTLTIYTVNYPGDVTNNVRTMGPYSITPNLQFVPLRIRARFVAFRIDWAPRLGFGARLGVQRFLMAPDGKRP